MMYQLNEMEMWRQRGQDLLHEAENGRRGSRGTRRTALGFLTALLVTILVVVGAGGPASASTTFTVTNTFDPGDGNCNDSGCTLREAITAANNAPGADTINFNIQPAEVVHIISPSSRLPVITEAVTINGYSQPGSSPNTLAKGTNANILIGLNLANAGGLEIEANDTVVRGLVINNSRGSGVSIESGTGNRIEGNFLGTDASGTLDRGNFAFGAQIDGGRANTIGGNSPFQRNLISGNESMGIEISSNSAGSNVVQGNLIGTTRNGTAPLGNSGEGIYVDSPNNTIGGTGLGEANVIAFNGSDGVFVEFVEGNTLNTGNRIFANSIFSNDGLGIDLDGGTENASGATKNDLKDPDTGANALQNKPVLTSVTTSGGKTTIRGKLNSVPRKIFVIQFFTNTSGNEGRRFLSHKAVTTDADGNISFSFVSPRRVPVGQLVSATATDSVKGNTSEFSAPRAVVAG